MGSGSRLHWPHWWAAWVLVALVAASCGSTQVSARARVVRPVPAVTPSPSPAAVVPTPSALPIARPKPSARPLRLPAVGRYAFPVIPATQASFGHTHHDYPATDIFAPCGDTFVAPTAGLVLSASRVDSWDPSVNAGATRGGLSVTMLGDDGVRYYGSHLRAVLPAVAAGARVSAGQALGQVGNTGDARGIACHLHFGISPPCGTTDWYNRRGLVYPWPYLESWRAGGQLSPAPAVAAYRSRYGCPTGPTTDP